MVQPDRRRRFPDADPDRDADADAERRLRLRTTAGATSGVTTLPSTGVVRRTPHRATEAFALAIAVALAAVAGMTVAHRRQ